jgi:hypothetical protein
VAGNRIYYDQSGFNTLLKAAIAHNNPKDNYYFVVTAPPNDKTKVQNASSLFATAPKNIHPVYEFNRNAWNSQPGTWQQKGQEFRQELTASGLPANTMWAVNELGSGMRAKSSAPRRHMEGLLNGLSSNGPGQPRDRGIVFQQGPGYGPGLKNEMKDNAFWRAMKQDAWRYMPETYAGPKRYLKMSAQGQHHYLFGADPRRAPSAPMMSAFIGGHGYGTANVKLPEMLKFVASQRAQMLRGGKNTFGFAWNEHPTGMSPEALAALANAVVRG